ncbi:haloacid dehalogenase type II [Pontibacter chitinilyticus]|uniref:haloacid dehalogenase type II n=1 Tax=Pontibacter chitinilyticus TaxID=2674989 RepID=UPI00321B4C1F
MPAKLNTQTRPAALVFDVNETLLDLSEMQEAVNSAYGNELAFKLWFSHLLEYALVENSTNSYHNFSAVGKAAMQMITAVTGKDVPEATQKELLQMIKETKPHPDVAEGLQKLQDAGFLMATLTNSPGKSSFPHLEQVKLKQYFKQMLSVDSVEKFKPAGSTYQFAAQQLDVPLTNLMLVAAHGWDIAGALRAGARAAFIERPGKVLYPLAPTPEIKAPTILELAEKLIQLPKA